MKPLKFFCVESIMTRRKRKAIDFGKLKPNKKSKFKGNWLTVVLRFLNNIKIGK